LTDGIHKEFWQRVSEPILAACVDLSRGLAFWGTVAVLHYVQLQVLRYGWSPFAIHALDKLEEYAVLVSVFVLFLEAVSSFAWAAFGRARRGWQ
jgi:hypothetical protein